MPKEKLDINEAETDELLGLVNQQYGYDFTNYSRASMHRRICMFIDVAGFSNVRDLKIALRTDKRVFDFFLQRITVNVTEMFRDPDFYKVIRLKVLPVIASYPTIKIWQQGAPRGRKFFRWQYYYTKQDY